MHQTKKNKNYFCKTFFRILKRTWPFLHGTKTRNKNLFLDKSCSLEFGREINNQRQTKSIYASSWTWTPQSWPFRLRPCLPPSSWLRSLTLTSTSSTSSSPFGARPRWCSRRCRSRSVRKLFACHPRNWFPEIEKELTQILFEISKQITFRVESNCFNMWDQSSNKNYVNLKDSKNLLFGNKVQIWCCENVKLV